VVSQSNDPGSQVEKGTGINIQLSKGPEKHTYKCVTNVEAPTGYTGGNATITLTAADGTTRSFQTSSFPFSINETGFNVNSGNITVTFESQVQETMVNPDTGEQSVETTVGTVTSNPIAVNFAEE
jgi:beta-lactam-binding protein with PASTA domain